jgi:hypothetical protein
MLGLQELSEAHTETISTGQALHQLISPPETQSQIRVVMRAFFPVVQLMPEILADETDPDMVNLRNMLPSIIELCEAIRDESKEASSWKSTSEEKPRITPYPTYRALLEIGDKQTLSNEQQAILAHVFIAIWRGVPGTDDGRVPASNIQHVFLEFRRPHLWQDKLEGVDTSRLNKCYMALKKREDSLKDSGELVAKHIAPIRRLLGLSLQKESLIERGAQGESEDLTETDDHENSPVSDYEVERIQIDPEDSDEIDSGAMIECSVSPIRTLGDEEKFFQTAERNALPADDLMHRPMIVTSPGASKHRTSWGGTNAVARDRGKSDQIRRSNQNLTNRWERPTEYELYVFWKAVTEAADVDASAGLALLLVLLTGRTLDRVLETQLKSKLRDLPERGESGRLYICYETAVWQSAAPQPERKGQIDAELRHQLIQTVPSIRLPIVGPLWNALERHVGFSSLAWRGALFKKHEREGVAKRATDLLARMAKHGDVRLTLKRIQRALFRRLSDGAGDMVEAILIAGDRDDISRHSGIHYYCVYESDLQEVYLTSITRLMPAFRDELVPVTEVSSDRRIGSPYCPTPHPLRQLATDLKTHFDAALRQPIGKSTLADIHNAYTLYTVLLVFFCTGYRTVQAPLSRITDVDLNRGYVVISDKDGDDWSHSRIVPLTENFLNHWAYYLRHRRHVVRNVETYLGEPDPGHVFFFLSTSDTRVAHPITVTPDEINKRVSPFSRLPLNIGRHLLRSELLHRRLPASVVDTVMGHWVAGREPMGRFSTLSPVEYRTTLVPVLEEIQAELGWTPVRGLG